MIIIDKETKLEYDTIESGVRSRGTHFFYNGRICPLLGTPVGNEMLLVAIRPRHTFGGIVFEETGEFTQYPERGQWFCPSYNPSGPTWCPTRLPQSCKVTILKPISVDSGSDA